MTDTSKPAVAAVVERLKADNDWLMRIRIVGGELQALHAGNNMLRSASLLSALEARAEKAEAEIAATVRKFNADNPDEFWRNVIEIQARVEAAEAERDTWKDLALKKEAFILSKAQDIEAAEAQVATLQAKLEKSAEALEPFAKGGAAVTHAFGEALFPESSMAFPSGCNWSENGAQCVVTWGDFRRAASTLSTLREAGNGNTNKA